jgi:hypothetical protein
MWVRSLISHIKGRKQTETCGEEGGGSCYVMEATAERGALSFMQFMEE